MPVFVAPVVEIVTPVFAVVIVTIPLQTPELNTPVEVRLIVPVVSDKVLVPPYTVTVLLFESCAVMVIENAAFGA